MSVANPCIVQYDLLLVTGVALNLQAPVASEVKSLLKD